MPSIARLAPVMYLVSAVIAGANASELPQPSPIGSGWFYYERPAPPEPPPESLPPQEPAQQSATSVSQPAGAGEGSTVRIDHAWLKEQLPRLQEAAFNNPTDQNLAAYWGAMRITTDMSTRFANRSKEWFAQYPELSEDRRRPNVAAALHARQDAVLERQLDLLASVWKSGAGLWFFYRSDCPYCHKQLPILEILAKSRGVDIIGVAIDGMPLNETSNIPWVPDLPRAEDGQTAAQRLGITMTPSIVLVTPDWQFKPVATGLASGTDITSAVIRQAHSLGLITDSDAMLANEVYDINAVDGVANAGGVLEVDAARLQDDPAFLNEVVLEHVRRYGPIDGTPVYTSTPPAQLNP